MTTPSRYPGSRSFQDTELDRLLFCGRERERHALLHLVLAEELVLLYAKSGTGKTSLLNAGVLRELRDRDYLPFMIRLNDPQQDPILSVREQVLRTAEGQGVEVEAGDTPPYSLPGIFGALKLWKRDVLLTPILIFDQFEELFTVNTPEQRQRFIEQFGDLARGQPDEKARNGAPAPIGGPVPKIIISLREDYLGELELVAAVVPRVMAHRFRLTALTREQAEQAILKPAAFEEARLLGQGFTFDPDAVEEILDFLCTQREKGRLVQGSEVEPFQLQILCQHLESRMLQPARAGTERVVRPTDLGGQAGMESILQGFYTSKMSEFAEADRRLVQRLCERGLISETGKRLSREEEEIERQFGVRRELLVTLIEQRLLRADPRTGSTYYELSHDTLVVPILRARDERDPEALLRAAETERLGGRYSAAIDLYQRAVGLDPMHALAYLRWGNILAELGRLDEAAQVLSTALEQGIENETIYHALGRVMAGKRDYKAALDRYTRALKLNDKLAVVHADMAAAYSEDGQMDQAASAYRRAIELDPKNAVTLRNLALLYIRTSQFERAIEVYRGAVTANPEHAYIFEDLAKELLTRGRHDLARDLCRIALTVDSKDGAFFRNVGNHLLSLHERDDALKAFAASAQRAPDDAWTYLFWGVALLAAQRTAEGTEKLHRAVQLDPVNVLSVAGEALIDSQPEQALSIIKRAVDFDPTNISTHASWARALRRTGRLDEAEAAYRKALAIKPDEAELISGLARLEQERGNIEHAEALLRKAMELAPAEPAHPCALGDLLREKTQRWEEAEAAYRRALDIKPEYGAAINNLALLENLRGRVEQAEGLFRRAMELEPTEPLYPRNLGDLLCGKTQRWEEAEAAYRKALEIRPEYVAAVHGLALLEQQRGRVEQAEGLFRRAMELEPTEPLYPRNLGDLLREKTQRWEEAEAAYRKALEIRPEYVAAVNGLALLEQQRGRVEQAEGLFRRAMELEPTEPLYPRNLGDLLREKTQRWEEAEAAYRKALEIRPEYAPAINGLALLEQQRGRVEQAEGLFRRAMKLAQAEPAYPWFLGDLLREKSQRWEEAEAAYRKALEIRPEYAPAIIGLALLEQQRGRVEHAEALLRKAMELAPAEPAHPCALGDLLREKSQRWEEAEAAYRKALEIRPEYAPAINGLALLEQQRGRVEQAEGLFRRATELVPADFFYARNLANLLSTGNRWDEEKSVLRDFINRNPTSGEACNDLAWKLLGRGELPEAWQLSKKAVELQTQPEALHTFAEVSLSIDDPQAMDAVRDWLISCSPEFSVTYQADVIATFRKVLGRGKGQELLALLRGPKTALNWTSWGEAVDAALDPTKVPALPEKARTIHQALVT